MKFQRMLFGIWLSLSTCGVRASIIYIYFSYIYIHTLLPLDERINQRSLEQQQQQHRYEDLNVNEIAAQLKNLSKQEKNTRIVYPHGQGKRTRRMIHLFSDLIGLRHWSEGKRKTRRIIVEK